jgi:hypothetical protein
LTGAEFGAWIDSDARCTSTRCFASAWLRPLTVVLDFLAAAEARFLSKLDRSIEFDQAIRGRRIAAHMVQIYGRAPLVTNDHFQIDSSWVVPESRTIHRSRGLSTRSSLGAGNCRLAAQASGAAIRCAACVRGASRALGRSAKSGLAAMAGTERRAIAVAGAADVAHRDCAELHALIRAGGC